MLEFGKYSSSGKILVVCPKTFSRRGNVEIECYRENIPMFETVEDLKNYISSRIGSDSIIWSNGSTKDFSSNINCR